MLKWEKIFDGTFNYSGGNADDYKQYFSMPALSNAFVNGNRLIFIFDFTNNAGTTTFNTLHIGVSNNNQGNNYIEVSYASNNGVISKNDRVYQIAFVDIVNNTSISNFSSLGDVELQDNVRISSFINGIKSYFVIGGRCGVLRNCSIKIYKQNAYNGIS